MYEIPYEKENEYATLVPIKNCCLCNRPQRFAAALRAREPAVPGWPGEMIYVLSKGLPAMLHIDSPANKPISERLSCFERCPAGCAHLGAEILPHKRLTNKTVPGAAALGTWVRALSWVS